MVIMKYRKKYLICILTIVFVFSGQLISGELQEFYSFSYGDWVGGAYRLDDGSFSHCHVATAYANGIVLAIALTDENEINLLIVKKSWNLPLDRSFQASLSIDGKSLGNYYAIATDDTSLQIDIGNNAEFFKKLRLGNKLVYESENDILSFGLRGTNKALGKVRECVDQASSSQSSQ
jgi:hypothetical protein